MTAASTGSVAGKVIDHYALTVCGKTIQAEKNTKMQDGVHYSFWTIN